MKNFLKFLKRYINRKHNNKSLYFSQRIFFLPIKMKKGNKVCDINKKKVVFYTGVCYYCNANV